MDIRKLQKIAVAALEDIKGKNIEILNTAKISSMFDRVIICTGDSNRQVKALARNVLEKVREAGGEVISIEGEEGGEWVLVDLGEGDELLHLERGGERGLRRVPQTHAARTAGQRHRDQA